MTATHSHYLVAYPHPSIPPTERIRPYRVGPEFKGELLKEIRAAYPQYSDDLKGATLWKVSCLTVVQLPP